MTPLWTAAAAAAATAGRLNADWHAQGVSIDSRTVAAGELFIALTGPKFDGHDYVAAALARGAAAAVVSRVPATLAPDAPLLVVADTQGALEDLGRAARRRTGAAVVAVTGSVGKTSTKEALRRAFERQGRTVASAGSLNNQWGVPLSLSRMPRDTAFGVFELGMNHPGEIAALTRLVRPDVAVITTIEPAHLGFFSSLEAIADAKAEIFEGVEPGGAAVLNRDNPHFARLAAAATARGITRILGFGAHGEAAVRLIDCHLHATASAVTAAILGEIVDYCVAIPGRHWVMNSLAVLAAVTASGGDVSAAAAALGTIEPLDGRGRRHKIAVRGGTAELIDESYNASPAAMRAALVVLGASVPGQGGRRIAVLGDMRELGAASAELHAALAGPIIDAGIDLVFTVGEDMRGLFEALPPQRRGAHRATAAEAAELVAEHLSGGDVVTVKGSAAMRMREVVQRLASGQAAVAVKG
jgi:UDP-N-acetylmuramoyl-tripeptide--D-alanyl-D-alanine ligase